MDQPTATTEAKAYGFRGQYNGNMPSKSGFSGLTGVFAVVDHAG